MLYWEAMPDTAKSATPPVGSERHTGATPGGDLTVIQCKTESGKLLTLYNFPCHPTVLGPDNLLASADFAAGIEALLNCDIAVFLNGAAGDISTRFTRQESSFAECSRMSQIAAKHVQSVIQNLPFAQPEPLRGIHTMISLQPRPIVSVTTAQAELQERTTQWEDAKTAGADAASLHLLKTYVEGAWVNLEFAKSMAGIQQLDLPVTVFCFAGMEFATIPGELFSTLQPEGLYLRAGGLALVHGILPPELMLHEMANKSTYLERVEGYSQALVCQVVDNLVKAGIEPPVFKSSNVDGGDAHNNRMFDKYYGYWK